MYIYFDLFIDDFNFFIFWCDFLLEVSLDLDVMSDN